MSDMVLTGGTVVTAEASFPRRRRRRGRRIAAVGGDLPADGAEDVDVSGGLLMPGFIDAHTHMDMPFGGTITADDWDTGTAAAVAGGRRRSSTSPCRTRDGSLGDAIETWQAKADGKTRIDYGLHVAIATSPTP